MTTRTILVVCLAVTVFAMPAGAQVAPPRRVPGGGAPNEPGGRFRPSPALEASCVIRIDFDPATLPLNTQLVSSLIRSDPIAGQAVKETGCEGLDCILDLVPLATSGNFIASVIARAPQDKGATKDKLESFLGAVCKLLEKALIEAALTRQAQWKEGLQQLDGELARVQSRLEDLRNKQRALSAKAGRFELSGKNVPRQIALLERDKGNLENRAVVQGARLQAIQEQIAKIGTEAAEKLKDDPIAAELAKIVTVRETQLKLIVEARKQGRANEAEAGEAEAKLAEARVELARRRDEVARAAGAEFITKLNQELVNLSISAAEQKAQLELMTKSLTDLKTRDMLRLADEFQRLETEAQLAERLCADLVDKKQRSEVQFRGLRSPAVTIIGGKPAAAETK
ncbi:MAG: hypothetical protein AMJ81_08935 [Phycisphaerae bacterium SM23_33]|jgi:hypothetical protein|nr:MAG: hypothetical protein AMJ81_08935 [Phycisphaerae bacterium SM23_33]